MREERLHQLAYENTQLIDYTREGNGRRRIDIPYLVMALVLLVIGLVMLLSASYAENFYDGYSPSATFIRQTVFALVGIGFMLILSILPMRFYIKMTPLLLIISIAALMLLLVPGVGVTSGGATRWIGTKNYSFQPSELAKISIILYYANGIARLRPNGIKRFASILMMLAILGATVILLAREPHYSAIMICGTLGMVLLFVGGLKPREIILILLLAAGVLALFVMIKLGGSSADAEESGGYYVNNRLSAWLDPFEDAQDTGYQVVQSLYTIGSGGLLGVGLGNSRQKLMYLPEEYNDYIFSIVCEELGYIGAVLIILLFALFIARGFWIARHARDKYSSLVAMGITTMFAVQVFLNIAVCANIIPSTGISLPLFSYGGTALLVQLGEIGIMLSISRDIKTGDID